VVIVALMFILSVLIATAQQTTVERLQATAPAIKKWGGIILVGIGVWFLILGTFAERFAGLFPV
jgi:protein-S-isoprenylcysteine O-methyltransferase Ste14